MPALFAPSPDSQPCLLSRAPSCCRPFPGNRKTPPRGGSFSHPGEGGSWIKEGARPPLSTEQPPSSLAIRKLQPCGVGVWPANQYP